MGKFKVGDMVVCVNNNRYASQVKMGVPKLVQSISPCGEFLRVSRDDCHRVGGYYKEDFIIATMQDDPLPPAPESVLYVNAYKWGIKVNNLGDELQVGVGDPNTGHGWTYASLDADTALQLCHDLRRMAMEIRRKERNG